MFNLLKILITCVVATLSLAPTVFAQGDGAYVEREDDSDVMYIADDNARMNAAIDEAVDTIDVFFDALESGKYPRDSFMLKILTETMPEEYEHMWYVFVDFTDADLIEGYLVHNPYASGSQYREGEVYELSPEMVTDGRFEDDGKLRGDFTTHVLLDIMAKDQPEQAAEQMTDYHDNPLPEE